MVDEKEGPPIIFGTTKFYMYLFRRKFTLRTDHKPLFYLWTICPLLYHGMLSLNCGWHCALPNIESSADHDTLQQDLLRKSSCDYFSQA